MLDIEKIKKEYEEHGADFLNFQKEVFVFLEKIKAERESVIDILEVTDRPDHGIKSIDSISSNIKNGKYEKANNIFDIKDIAGVRITCHCESDRLMLYNILRGELRKEFANVDDEEKSGPYYANHFNVTRGSENSKVPSPVYCEIQVRTVTGNAWAVQDHKYVYKDADKEGDSAVVTKAIANVMNALEQLWDFLKEKNGSKDIEIKVSDVGKVNELVEAEKNKVEAKIISDLGINEKQDDETWMNTSEGEAIDKFKSTKYKAFMEIRSLIVDGDYNYSEDQLVEAADGAQIKTFGWPIGIMRRGHPEFGPKPKNGGIVLNLFGEEPKYFDYWAIRKNSAFYLLKSIFEDERSENTIYFNTRIVRITETLLYLSKLYSALGVNNNDKINITITHGGLKGRILSAVGNRRIFERTPSEEDVVSTTIETTISDINTNLVDNVVLFTEPLFVKFDFFKIGRDVLEDIVNRFLKGEVS